MSEHDREDLARRFVDDERVDSLVKKAVRNALSRHKRLGNPIAVWKDGKPVWLPAKDIPHDNP
ncbi:MAG TPA: hypothetical protein VGE01_10610 [Fimbriimonas sp.]